MSEFMSDWEMYNPHMKALRDQAEARQALHTLPPNGTREAEAVLAAFAPAQPYITKDSGTRASYDSGMVRDTQDGKPRFDLLIPEGVPFEAQFLTRCADLMTRGAVKYGARNFECADSAEELERFKASAIRHLMQWASGGTDEDHQAAVFFNLMAYETTKWKMENGSSA